MTTDLTMLAATGVLAALLTAPYGIVMWATWPIGTVLGNRDGTPPLPAWAERAQRAQRNMLENLPHFTVFVLVAHAAGLSNAQTALGATIFFWARLVHAVVYITGVWPLRGPAFFAGFAAELLIVGRLFGWSLTATTVGIVAFALGFATTVAVLRRVVTPMHGGASA